VQLYNLFRWHAITYVHFTSDEAAGRVTGLVNNLTPRRVLTSKQGEIFCPCQVTARRACVPRTGSGTACPPCDSRRLVRVRREDASELFDGRSAGQLRQASLASGPASYCVRRTQGGGVESGVECGGVSCRRTWQPQLAPVRSRPRPAMSSRRPASGGKGTTSPRL